MFVVQAKKKKRVQSDTPTQECFRPTFSIADILVVGKGVGLNRPFSMLVWANLRERFVDIKTG